MVIDYHPRAQKGVTQLMYVGDDGMVDHPSYPKWWLVAGGLLLAAWLMGRETRKRR
jgi:hypothetical protein